MYDHRKVEFLGKIQLANEQFDLGIPISEFMVVVQTDLADRDYPIPLAALRDTGFPVIPRPGDFGRRYTDAVIDVILGFQVFVDLVKIPKIVADAYDTDYIFLFCFLNNHQLFDRIFCNETNMCV